MILLGIDPGSHTCGYGVLESQTTGFRVVDCGCLRAANKESAGQRLLTIFTDVQELMAEFVPDEVVLEEAFFAKDAKAAFLLGQVRGIVILAAAQREIHVVEISAKLVKKRITGNGNAKKEQVQAMIRQRLRLGPASLPLDASDALAIALAHGQEIHYV